MSTTTMPRPHQVDAIPLPGPMLAVGLQHVLVMYAGAIAVPLIVGGAFRLPREQIAFLINADLFACGVATLIQCLGVWKFGIRLPVVMGVTFTAVAPIVAMAATGTTINEVFGGVIVAGLFTMALAPFASRLVGYFPPVVTGTVIAVIGITLLRIGVNWAGGGIGAQNFGDPANLGLALLVLVIVLAINKLFDGFVASIAVLLGLAIGYCVALALGRVDFSGVRSAEWFALVYPFRFGAPGFNPVVIVTLCVVMIVVMVESTGMFLALGEICERKVGAADISRGLAADGLGTLIGGVFNTFPYTSFSQNVGLVSLTGVRSRWVVAVSGAILIVFGLFPKMGGLVASIPPPVLGGAGLVMFGMVAATGIRILSRVDYESRHNLLIVAVSLGVGLIPLVAPTLFGQLPKWMAPLLGSGITLCALCAVLLNALFNGASGGKARRD
jgi:NCS2 family nucleobase:cation symporter-2